MTGSSLPPEYFADLYAARADPWGLEESWYEQRKRDCVLAALPAQRARRAFEPGCANGALSVRLADRCDRLVCWDATPAPVAAARARCRDRPHVSVEVGEVPESWPSGHFDLVVISELAYYLGPDDRARLWTAATACLVPGGVLLAVHWVREAPEYPITGGPVHDELDAVAGLAPLASHREADFRLDVHARTPPQVRSVAERVGLR